MTKREAKRWVCQRLGESLTAGLVEDEALELDPADQSRITEVTAELITEMGRRARDIV